MAIDTTEAAQPSLLLSGKAIRRLLVCSIWVAMAIQPGHGGDIYRWVDANGKTHFSDSPPSADGNQPLRATTPPPSAQKNPAVAKDHYSVLNQVRRLEHSRGERGNTASNKSAPSLKAARNSRQGTGQPSRRQGSAPPEDFGYDGWESYNNLGPRTDLTRFPNGHPVYSPRLGFPSESRRPGRQAQPFYQESPYARRPSRGGGALVWGR